MKLYHEFLKIIKNGLKEAGITQEVLAYDLDMYPSQVSLFLSGKSTSISMISRVLAYLEEHGVNLTMQNNDTEKDKNKEKLDKIKEILSAE